MTPLERAVLAHLVADWLLQDDWMARNKMNLRHPAGWVHGAIHAACLTLALDWRAGLALGFVHVLIDSRKPVAWWIRWVKRCEKAPDLGAIALWLDQVFHLVCLAAWVAWVPA